MPIDSSIALNVQPVKIESPLNRLSRVMQLQNLQQQGEAQDLALQQTRQGIDRQNRLMTLLGGFTPDMTPEQQAQALTRGGHLSEAQSVTKTAADTAKTRREAEKSQIENALKKIEVGGQILGSVKDESTYQAARQAANQAGFEQWPEQYNPTWVNQQIQQGQTLKDRAEQEWRKRQDETTRRGQDLVNARYLEANKGAKTGKDRDTEMKLFDDYKAQSKDFKSVTDAYSLINKTLDQATKSPAATLAAATKFMKLLDPGSVVRESELGMALAASGVFDRATNYVNVLQSGRVLTPDQVKDFKNITGQIYQAAQGEQQKIDADYKSRAEAYGLSPDRIIQQIGQGNKPAQPAPQQSGQDKEALDWANANPNDPRAAKIKAKLGVK